MLQVRSRSLTLLFVQVLLLLLYKNDVNVVNAKRILTTTSLVTATDEHEPTSIVTVKGEVVTTKTTKEGDRLTDSRPVASNSGRRSHHVRLRGVTHQEGSNSDGDKKNPSSSTQRKLKKSKSSKKNNDGSDDPYTYDYEASNLLPEPLYDPNAVTVCDGTLTGPLTIDTDLLVNVGIKCIVSNDVTINGNVILQDHSAFFGINSVTINGNIYAVGIQSGKASQAYYTGDTIALGLNVVVNNIIIKDSTIQKMLVTQGVTIVGDVVIDNTISDFSGVTFGNPTTIGGSLIVINGSQLTVGLGIAGTTIGTSGNGSVIIDNVSVVSKSGIGIAQIQIPNGNLQITNSVLEVIDFGANDDKNSFIGGDFIIRNNHFVGLFANGARGSFISRPGTILQIDGNWYIEDNVMEEIFDLSIDTTVNGKETKIKKNTFLSDVIVSNVKVNDLEEGKYLKIEQNDIEGSLTVTNNEIPYGKLVVKDNTYANNNGGTGSAVGGLTISNNVADKIDTKDNIFC